MLLPPLTPKRFESDAHLRLNLSICPSGVAPFHVHDAHPAAIAAMLCFDECHVRNLTTKSAPPPIVDDISEELAAQAGAGGSMDDGDEHNGDEEPREEEDAPHIEEEDD